MVDVGIWGRGWRWGRCWAVYDFLKTWPAPIPAAEHGIGWDPILVWEEPCLAYRVIDPKCETAVTEMGIFKMVRERCNGGIDLRKSATWVTQETCQHRRRQPVCRTFAPMRTNGWSRVPDAVGPHTPPI